MVKVTVAGGSGGLGRVITKAIADDGRHEFFFPFQGGELAWGYFDELFF
jgi:hypothetical protein